MSENFDKDAAASRHKSILNDVEDVRDFLRTEVINFYDRSPDNEDDQRKIRDGLREYLRKAQNQIDDILSRLNNY